METHDDLQEDLPGPLRGFRILDLTQYISGPYATKLLADYGADVIKIERPDGDPGRQLGPFDESYSDTRHSLLFDYLNTNKRSMALDLKEESERKLFLELVATCDLIVESYAPGTMDRLGLGLKRLREVNPRVSVLSLTNFGQTGPYRDWKGSDLVLYAMGGEMFSNGVADREPLKTAGSVALIYAGAAAAVAGAAALRGARQGLEGQYIDVSIFETLLASPDRRHAALHAHQFTNGREVVQRKPAVSAVSWGRALMPCADGYIEIYPRWRDIPRLRTLLNNPAELADPAFEAKRPSTDPALLELMQSALLEWLMERGKRQAWVESQRAKVISGPLYTVQDLFEDPVFNDRGFFVSVPGPGGKAYKMPGAPIRMHRSPWRLRYSAPAIDQHRAEIIAEESAFSGPVPMPTTKRLPLEGIRVIDMTLAWAGPFGTMMLADLGAEVIKVENNHFWVNQARGISAHPTPESIPPHSTLAYPHGGNTVHPYNASSTYIQPYRNKLGATMDLRTAEGREAFERLVRVADVFCENNVPETMEKLGISYEYLSRLNPNIIMVRAPGFGIEGQYRDFRAFGIQIDAVVGHSLLRHYPDTDPSTNLNIYPADAFAASKIAFAVTAALAHRDRTGEGQLVEISQAEAAVGMLAEYHLDYAVNRRLHEPIGTGISMERRPAACFAQPLRIGGWL